MRKLHATRFYWPIALGLLLTPLAAQPQREQGKQPPPARGQAKPKDLPKTLASWTVRTPMPTSLVEHMAGVLEDAGANSTRILVMGGRSWGNTGAKTPNTDIFLFDPFANTWSTMPMKCGLVGYSIGGEMGYDVFLFGANEGMPSTSYFYNPQSTSLATRGQLTTTRRWPAVVNLKNNAAEMLVIGGRDQNGMPVNTIEKVSGTTSTVMPGPDLSSLPMSAVSAARLPSGKIFMVGQKSPGDNRWTIYDPNNATAPFTGTQNFPTGSGKGIAQVAYSAHHNKLLVVIGPESLPGHSMEVFWVDPVTYTWSPAPLPSSPDRGGALLLGTKAGFFLIGGASPQQGTFKLVEQL